MADRTLLCLIEGESTLFTVKLAGGMRIHDLKRLIKESRPVISSVDPTEMTLWKVRMTMASGSTTNPPAG